MFEHETRARSIQVSSGASLLVHILTYQCGFLQVAIFVLWCYGSKFLVTLFMAPIVYAAALTTFCAQIVTTPLNSSQCSVIDPSPVRKESWGGWEKHPYTLSSAQQLAAFVLVAHFGELKLNYSIIDIVARMNKKETMLLNLFRRGVKCFLIWNLF